MAAAAGLILTASNCLPHDALAADLEKRYQEQRAAFSVTNTGAILELYTGPDQDTWTLVITAPNGMSCMIAAGHHWQRVNMDRKEPEA